MKTSYLLPTIASFFLLACNSPQTEKIEKIKKTEKAEEVKLESLMVKKDPLPSWNDTPTKKAIIDFVTSAASEKNGKFIPVTDRIATFDNDGTLWSEQPLYFEMVFSIDATKEIASQNTGLQKKPELKALVSGDKAGFMKSGEKGILEAFAISHTAVKPDLFNQMAQTWLDTTIHTKYNQKYVDLTYLPMVELLQYLRDHQFKTYIVSGGSSIFIRNFSQKAYGIPAEQVIGTMFQAEYKDGNISLKPEVWHNDDGAGKPEAIFNIIGKKPVLAFGNSDGDFEMLEWTSTNTLPNLSLILHHTDAEREVAYDSLSNVGRLKKGLIEGPAKGWIIVDMKKDFAKVFSFN